MVLIENTLDGRIDRVKIAIDRIKSFDPEKFGLGEPYYVAYSGGKDSDVIRILCQLADVKYELVHNHTTVDAPETVRYVRSIPGINIDYPKMSIWELIVKHGMPPTRIIRYCCAELKERGGRFRFVMTGVRWAESTRRKGNRGIAEVLATKRKDKIILNADNAENRRLFEHCTIKGKRVVNPIIDWSDADVWEFLDHYGCKSNPLYQEGYDRIGCVGCPMSREKRRRRDFNRFPKYADNYIRAFDKMILSANDKGKTFKSWRTGQDVFDWWIKDSAYLPEQLEGQIEF